MEKSSISSLCDLASGLSEHLSATRNVAERRRLLQERAEVEAEQVAAQQGYEDAWGRALRVCPPRIRARERPGLGLIYYLTRSIPGVGGSSEAICPQNPHYAAVHAAYLAQQAR